MTTQIAITENKINWSGQQLAIFDWFATPQQSAALVVMARAGTGKTTSIVEALNRCSASDRRILACAFNKTIERELTARITDKRVTVKTLHGAGYGVMIRAWGYPESDGARGTRIAREICGATAVDDAVTMVAALASIAKGTMPFLGVDRKCYGDDLADLTSLAEEFGHVPDEAMARAGWDCGAIVKAALECMRAACRKDAGLAIREDGSKGKTCVDFDDMTYLPVRLGLARATYDLTVVDEAQDMSPTQILLAQALTYSAGRMVYVGDSEQAIYSWRGADVNVLSRVVEDFGATVLPLNITRRCPKSVVALAAQIVPDFTAADDAPDGIVDSLATPALLLATAKPGDAILSRKNAPLADLCLALLRNGVRARIEGRDIGAALCGLARKVAGRAVASMTMETFSERLGKWADRRIAKLTESAIKRGDVRLSDEGVSAIVDQRDTLLALAEDVDTVSELCDKVSMLFSNAEDRTGQPPCVVLSSIHKAKGKEWGRVFVLVGALRNGGEEDRLRYVAYTRAKSHLTLCQGFESKRSVE